MNSFLKKDKIKITVIGAGNLAHSLIPALIEKEYNIISVFDIHNESAKKLAEKYNIGHYSDALFNIEDESNLFLLTVPDGEIKTVAGLMALLNSNYENSLAIHFSGSRNIHELDDLKEKGCSVGSIHPMQTFPSNKKVSMKKVNAAVESDQEMVTDFLFSLTEELEMIPLAIKPEDKVFYHLMGVFASNFMVANMRSAELSNVMINNSIPDLYKYLKPIVNSTYTNITKYGAVNSLSGPIGRGDFKTIEMHVEAIRNNKELLLHYITNSLSLLEIAYRNGSLQQREYNRIKLFLTSELKDISETL